MGDLLWIFEKAAVSLLIGVLVGMEREHSAEDKQRLFAGIRTFPLIGLFGFLSGMAAQAIALWMLAVCAAGFFALVVVEYMHTAREGDYGATSEVAALITYLLGIFVYWELLTFSIAIGVVLTLFLSLKSPLRKFTGKVREEDIYATLKFAIITAIILPVLPDRTMGPLDVLNPRQIWYMVVLIAGISFAGYLLVKILGSEKGIVLTGLLGGMVSSTAVTLSFSHKSRETPEMGRAFASAIILACTIMYPRILIEIAVVNPTMLAFLWPYITALILVGVAVSALLFRGARSSGTAAVPLENPFELKSAIKFGLVFGIILFVAKAARIYLGSGGVLLAAGLAGITDVDAITLSMANLSLSSLDMKTASTAVLLAVVTNTVVKGGIAFSLGAAALRRYTLPGFGALLAAGIVCIGILVMLVV